MIEYSMPDYPREDWSQYFEGSDVPFRYSNQVKMGTITGISRDTCIIASGRQSYPVSVNDVLWSGVPQPQIITYNNNLYLAAPIGAHTHKKGLTRDALSCLRLERNGTHMSYSGDVNDAEREGVYLKFVNDPAPISINSLITAAQVRNSTRARWYQFGTQAAIMFHGDVLFLVYNQGQELLVEYGVEDVSEEYLRSLIILVYGVNDAQEIED